MAPTTRSLDKLSKTVRAHRAGFTKSKHKPGTTPIDPIDELRALRALCSQQEATIGRLNNRIGDLNIEVRSLRWELGDIQSAIRNGTEAALQSNTNELCGIIEDVTAEAVASGVRLVLGHLGLEPRSLVLNDFQPQLPPPFNDNN